MEHSDALSTLLLQTNGSATIVFLEDAEREIEVGIHDFEFDSKQPVRFDIYAAHTEGPATGVSGIGDVLDYEYLVDALDHVIGMGRFDLLEEMAIELIDHVMSPESVIAATVKISKLHVPGSGGSLGCCITRAK
ncbi:MAG TPA: dihydroneopterin aldolase [Candidatus Thalassarchaeaceae archaeon]|jgi:dihydroneopterin aldolase|nr:dihydroneopterin aldolase [Candidatus Thalassarchaeaceae archaeon]|tara:strand:+ start:5156 stop:5557 length:402 start_codon:yes stop_codon:yes gene_type:complete